MYRAAVPGDILKSFGKLELADNYGKDASLSVDILVGLDHYWEFILPSSRRGPESLVAQETSLGWVISGSLVSQHDNLRVSHQLLCFNEIPEQALCSLWELESLGISPKEDNVEDPVWTEFQSKVCYRDGRYEVSLPWKSSKRPLDNIRLAKGRLDSLNRKLARDNQLQRKYNEVIQGMEAEGIIEEVPLSERNTHVPVYYMPHRPVVREDSISTKVRPVFDASAPGYNGVSLNDCLQSGPNMIPNLVEILIRFRRWKVALTSDIAKAFLQVGVSQGDRDVHRFLWSNNNQVRVMRFTRIPFGDKSSPFLLNATIRYHLDKFPPTRVVQELQSNFYVDDWLTGADSDEEAMSMLTEATDIMSQAGMSLAKWASNSGKVSEKLFTEFEGKYVDSESTKVLGLKWMSIDDQFAFEKVKIPSGLCVTKRVVLSFIARLFDPLGFLNPYIMSAKILFQELWKEGIDWDVEVPSETGQRFLEWVEGLQHLSDWRIPRSYTGRPWNDIQYIELHAFGDASEKGYGACVYLGAVMKDQSRRYSLVTSKAKVAPLKRVTLPRLELLGALVCARLLTFTIEALRLSSDINCYCWTDSTVVLAWIQSEPSRWKPFVGNRVAEIQRLTNPHQWKHCPGRDNPADLLTRGVNAHELVKSQIWLEGPQQLMTTKGSDLDQPCLSLEGLEETLSLESALLVSNCDNRHMLDVSRWSSLNKATRVVGWVVRFVYNARHPTEHLTGPLSLEEVRTAEIRLISIVQNQEFGEEVISLRLGKPTPKHSSLIRLDPYMGDDGLIRISGRLQCSELTPDEKHPIILPKTHFSLLVVRFYHILLKHAGVNTMITTIRNKYWIVGLRRLAKRVKRECISCQRQDAPAYNQPRAPLPGDRVKQIPPFSVTGMDHAGPLYCCDEHKKKFYILLFTCAVIRAVHLELVSSLTEEDTLLALRRFVARRGLPSIIYSDNAMCFKAVQSHLSRQFGTLSPKWKFIPPRSPWWGGWWERLVRSVKSALKKSVGTQILTRTELETTLHEIEACINSRPLTFVGDEVDSGSPLTPAHFLIGRQTGFNSSKTSGDITTTASDLRSREALRIQMLHKFWSVWSSDYIRNLPPWRGGSGRNEPREGAIVVIHEECYPRLHWPVGVITKVHPGQDGIIRAVDVKTNRGTFTRSVQRVHDLELTAEDYSPPDRDPWPVRNSPSKEEEHEPGNIEAPCTGSTSNLDMHVIGASADSDSEHEDDIPDTRVSHFGRVIRPRSMLDL